MHFYTWVNFFSLYSFVIATMVLIFIASDEPFESPVSTDLEDAPEEKDTERKDVGGEYKAEHYLSTNRKFTAAKREF